MMMMITSERDEIKDNGRLKCLWTFLWEININAIKKSSLKIFIDNKDFDLIGANVKKL